MTNLQRYAYWHSMMATTGIRVDAEHAGTIDGYWRMIGARTKADYPVAAWATETGVEALKVGRKAEFPLQSSEGQGFMAGSWPKCIACSEEEYNHAIDTGFWLDGKPSRIATDAQKLGVELGEGATGGNAPPSYELLSQQLDELTEKARKHEVKDQASADAAKVLADRIKLLWDQADKERDTEKRPHDDASKAVQAKWMAHMTPAEAERKNLLRTMNDWLAKEQQRLDEEARKETDRRREAARVQYETDATELIDADFEEKYGHAKPRPVVEGDTAPAAVFVPEVAAVQAPKATAGGAFTRNASAKKEKKATIVDADKLFQAIKDSQDVLDFLQKKADASLRAKIKLPGVQYEGL